MIGRPWAAGVSSAYARRHAREVGPARSVAVSGIRDGRPWASALAWGFAATGVGRLEELGRDGLGARDPRRAARVRRRVSARVSGSSGCAGMGANSRITRTSPSGRLDVLLGRRRIAPTEDGGGFTARVGPALARFKAHG